MSIFINTIGEACFLLYRWRRSWLNMDIFNNATACHKNCLILVDKKRQTNFSLSHNILVIYLYYVLQQVIGLESVALKGLLTFGTNASTVELTCLTVLLFSKMSRMALVTSLPITSETILIKLLRSSGQL